MGIESVLQNYLSKDVLESLKSSSRSKNFFKILDEIYNVGGVSYIDKSIDIINKSYESNLSTDLVKRISNITPGSWKRENILASIDLVYYTYVEKNYGRFLSEAIIEVFNLNKDKKFDDTKMSYAKEVLDQIYSEGIVNKDTIEVKLSKAFHKFFK